MDIHIDHPKFTQVKAIQDGDKRTLQTVMGVDDKAYEDWSKALD